MVGVRELAVFLAAAEQENFSAAARKLHLSQPAISFQIQSLEQQLQVQLFQRVGRRIMLTQAGRDLLPIAHEMIYLSSQIEQMMGERQGLVKGELVIGCSTSPGKYVLPRLLGAFHQLYPEVQSHVEIMDRQTVEDRLLTRQLHFGILGLPSKNKKLECWPFFTDELVLIVAEKHPWARRDQISPAEFREADWILREGGAATRHLILTALAEQGLPTDELRVAMELGSPEAVAVAVESGYGVSFVSRVAVERSLELGRLKTVSVAGMSLCRQVLLARNRSSTCNRVQLRFREFVESAQGQQVIQGVVG
ncbi:MAG: LysR family transcriptional regulator [Chloroflexi bacterium]|nr:LysR family transcriptional regulator [Chloroflexota bacterium]